nr:ABC transporter permease [Roseomonas acroporae]
MERRADGTLALSGRLDADGAAALWPRVMRGVEAGAQDGAPPAIDLAGITMLDTAGAVLVLDLAGPETRIEGAGEAERAVLDRTRDALAEAPPPVPPKPMPWLAWLGAMVFAAGRSIRDGTAFIGQCLVTALGLLRRPRNLRAADLLRQLDEVGLRAFPLTLLLGVLIGVILAFQSAIPLRRYGGEMFVPQLVGIVLLRELGPLIAAIIVAGRTGSAFAAELGTMTVNEEVDALRIMGIDSMAMLVLPRLIATLVAMPILALLVNLSGLVGMAVVMTGQNFPLISITNTLMQWLTLRDLLGGLFKAAVFGLAIAGIGCRAGLSAGRGPRAVGDAATAAVVGGIIATVVLDGLFAVLFSRLGI